MMQMDFLIELFTKLHAEGVHTCLDTSGIMFQPANEEVMKKVEMLMAVTSLVMLDIKHMDSACHRKLTGHDNASILAFARYLAKRQIPVWIRHVLVPGYTDQESDLRNLGQFIASLSNVKALDVLPYHTMGAEKYKALDIPYPLDGVEAATAQDAARAKQIILEAFKEGRKAAAAH